MYSIEKLRPYLLSPGINEGKLIKGIVQIQESFTRNLEKRNIYITEKDLVSSYAAFYLPTNLVKLSWGFSLLNDGLKKQLGATRLVDFGCGPGTFSLAWLEEFQEGEIVCVDQSELMLKQAESFLNAFFPNQNIRYQSSLPSIKEGTTLLFGNSLNEISVDDALGKIDSLKPDHIIFIEPGTKLVFSQLKQIRKTLIEKNYEIHYPCLNKSPCPMREDDWCHQVIRTTHHESIERISQKAKIDRRTMPLSFHVYSKLPRNIKEQARIVQFLRESKFSIDYRVCLGDRIVEIQIMKKKHSKKQIKEMKEINVGESISYEVIKEIEPSLFRVIVSFALEV